jgi:tripartite-type tricarboxylate transporter receptor subunit TctC
LAASRLEAKEDEIMRSKQLAIWLLAGCLVGGIGISRVDAQTWPSQTVRVITPFPAGSGGDITVRPYAEGLSKRWGKPVIVENRPGADGILAVTAVLGAADNHTLLYTNGGPLTSNPLVHGSKLPYDPARDLVPISSGADAFVALSVPASINVRSLAEFVKLARAQPGKLNWGATPGALDYLVPGFFRSSGIDLARVAYRDVAPAMQDLSQARLHLYASALATQRSMVQNGAINVLAVTNRERAPLMPEAPTAVEAGFPDLGFEGFLAFFGPRGMTTELRDRISADVRAIGADPAIAARFAGMGMIIRTNTPAELQQIVKQERSKIERFAHAIDGKPAQ